MQNKKLIHNQLYRWYAQNKRELPWRETTNAYFIWISEIILQQTRVEQGLPYYLRFIDRFPDLSTLANASEDEVLRYWQGLGYYSRARNLHKAAQQLISNGQNSFPTDFESIRALPGIGDYTAGAIAAFAYNSPYPALDGNVYRVLSRLTNCSIPFDTTAGKKHFHNVAGNMMDTHNARLFNSAIMELGALQCVPQMPDCGVCPLAAVCMAKAHNTVDLLPVRKPRPQLKDRYLQYDIYLAKETIFGSICGSSLVPNSHQHSTSSRAQLNLPIFCPINAYTHALQYIRCLNCRISPAQKPLILTSWMIMPSVGSRYAPWNN